MEPAQPQVTPETAPIVTPIPAPAPTPEAGLDFIPEAFRKEPWAQKYKSQDDFFKGVANMAKMVGQKQIVEGVKLPGEGATEDDFNNFFNQIGRPESADKYTLPEVQAPEGFDLENEKKTFSSLAHEAGLNQKQAEKLFTKYIATVNDNFTKGQEQEFKSFEDAVKATFPEDTAAGFAAAKRGAKAMGIADKLDESGLSANPLVLQLCAKVGELAKEDSFVPSKGNPETKESLLEQARKLQASTEYKNGDKATHRKVEEMYKKVYPG